jgi:hypothetical protein
MGEGSFGGQERGLTVRSPAAGPVVRRGGLASGTAQPASGQRDLKAAHSKAGHPRGYIRSRTGGTA